MKRIHAVCAVGLAVFLLGGCGRQQNNVAYIGAEKAKDLALEASGLSAADVAFSETDLSSRSGKDYYLVGFTAAGQDYEYDIDALTGVVIESRLPEAASGAGEGMNTVAADVKNGDTSAAGQKNTISEKEAAAKAMAHAGVLEGDATIVKNQLEIEDGRQVYDVEFYTKDYAEYDYEIDAVTGEVISYDYDAENFAPPESGGQKISEEEAKKLALERVPGAGADNIWEFEVDKEDGRLEYEGKIIYGDMEYEFEIDAYSGTFRSWEAEQAD
ncbi:MAG: hypothetical protein HFH30_03250 [Eubacterium sp.]|nr:hypothetical protein [Eubacterium sp.]MCI8917239.1 hypothetical protein [Eubacterium sp.]